MPHPIEWANMKSTLSSIWSDSGSGWEMSRRRCRRLKARSAQRECRGQGWMPHRGSRRDSNDRNRQNGKRKASGMIISLLSDQEHEVV